MSPWSPGEKKVSLVLLSLYSSDHELMAVFNSLELLFFEEIDTICLLLLPMVWHVKLIRSRPHLPCPLASSLLSVVGKSKTSCPGWKTLTFVSLSSSMLAYTRVVICSIFSLICRTYWRTGTGCGLLGGSQASLSTSRGPLTCLPYNS